VPEVIFFSFCFVLLILVFRCEGFRPEIGLSQSHFLRMTKKAAKICNTCGRICSPKQCVCVCVCVCVSICLSIYLNFLENLIVAQLVRKFSAFYGSRSFITMSIRTLHFTMPSASWIQSTPSHCIQLRSILSWSSHLCLCLPSSVFPLCFLTKILYGVCMSHLWHACYMPSPFHPPWFAHPDIRTHNTRNENIFNIMFLQSRTVD
jgi:hypothetical protein